MFEQRENRTAIALGLVLVTLILCCCFITIAGWGLGAYQTIGDQLSVPPAPIVHDASLLAPLAAGGSML